MNTKTCFIIMPFNNRFNDVYDQHIKPLIENQLKSVKCIRMDKHPKIGNIIDHIIKEITGSSFIIADITECNSNVFYEIGFAHALKKDVIFIPIALAQAVCRGNPDITVGILANGTHAKV